MLYYVVIMYIMTDKVFAENNRDKNDVDFLKQLENTFGHKVIIIPWHATGALDDEKADVYGHADGFIKYCGGNRILMGNHRDSDEEEAIMIRRKHSVNHVFSSPTSIINFTSKKPSYDDTRRSGRDNELLQRAQNDL